MSSMDERAARAGVELLANCRAPLLIGVRHHSAALARAMPELLSAAKPQRLLIELPSDLDPWLPWLAHPQGEAPLALAAAAADGSSMFFLPFADFSPELAALRWGLANGIPLHGIDLPTDRRSNLADDDDDPSSDHQSTSNRNALPEAALPEAVARRLGVDNPRAVWDRLVEDATTGGDAEAVRRAALAIGWAWRSAAPVSLRDRVREAWMCQRIAELGGSGAVAVIGAYHAQALSGVAPAADLVIPAAGAVMATSLTPYGFAQFDERSGYPAGVLDPAWHQAALGCSTAAQRQALVAGLAVDICRHLRQRGHQAAPADAIAVTRLTVGLAALRGLPAPGRGELVEAVQSALARGEVLGAGRAVAAALHTVLVGHARGRLPPNCPRSGLEPHVETLLAALDLPGPKDAHREPRDLRLDVLRSQLDRLRAVTLARLELLGVSYAERLRGDASGVGGDSPLGELWRLTWTHSTSAGLAAASLRGVTLEMAAAGALANDLTADQPAVLSTAQTTGSDELSPLRIVNATYTAGTCGLTTTASTLLARLHGEDFLSRADLPALVAALNLLQRARLGHLVGLPLSTVERPGMRLEAFVAPDPAAERLIDQAAERVVEGLAGSDREDDVRALLELAQTRAATGEPPGLRLAHLLHRFTVAGGPLMQGAASGLLTLAGLLRDTELDALIASWLAAGGDASGRQALRRRFAGLWLTIAPTLEGAPELLTTTHTTLMGFNDRGYLDRLPALRAAAAVLPIDDRKRMLTAVLQQFVPGAVTQIGSDLQTLALVAAADEAAWRSVEGLTEKGLTKKWHDDPPRTLQPAPVQPPASGNVIRANGAITAGDRWRLILGTPPEESGPLASGAGLSLEACYGGPAGAGRTLNAPGAGSNAGNGDPFPTVRAWNNELERLFSSDVRDEVTADRSLTLPAALELLDPATTTPSVALLERILSLKGGLPPAAAKSLRRLAASIVERLARELARRLRPALGPLGLARPARRGRQLDLRRTVRANLDGVVLNVEHAGVDHAGVDPAGSAQLIARRLIFRSRAKRTMDWHLVLVVDSSGSMEASVIHAALCAAVFNALPALSVQFLTVNTTVVDLTGRVDDPLELLLEVSIGGGTHLALGLHRARQELLVPSRSLVVLVSDFEEGVSVGQLLAEVRALTATGARCLGLAALDAAGQPRYHAGIAAQVVAAGMPVAALGPEQLAKWVGEQLR